MDATAIAALAAALGSLVGAGASIATTSITQRRETMRANAKWTQLVALYGTLSQIRLVSGEEVLREAEQCCRRIVELYRQPNLTADQIREAFEVHHLDPLKDFSASCHRELLAMSSRV
jgi:hypothetical protein